MYCTPIWKIRKVVYKAQVADSLINKQEIEIRQLTGAVVAADSSANAARQATEAAIQAGLHLENEVKLQEQKVTYWKRLQKKWKWGAIGAAVVIVLEGVVIGAQALGD